MLVLSRKVGEKIHIGDGIVVEIRRVAGNRVTVAVQAPREMRILRGELYEAAHAFEEQETADEVPAKAAAQSPSCVVPQHPAPVLEGMAQSVA